MAKYGRDGMAKGVATGMVVTLQAVMYGQTGGTLGSPQPVVFKVFMVLKGSSSEVMVSVEDTEFVATGPSEVYGILLQNAAGVDVGRAPCLGLVPKMGAGDTLRFSSGDLCFVATGPLDAFAPGRESGHLRGDGVVVGGCV